MLKSVVDFLSAMTGTFVNFMMSAVIPLVVWLVVLRADVNNLKNETASIKIEQRYANEKMWQQFARNEESVRIEQSKIQKNFEEIMRAVGRLEGKVNLIK